MIEARPAGMKPVAVSCKGDTVEQVFEGAMDKLHHLLDHNLLDHTFAKHNSHRRDQPDWREKNEDADPVAEEYEAD
jgi:hypothetical protein